VKRLALLATVIACFLPAPALAAGAFGINPGDLFQLPQAQWGSQLAAIASDGVQTVRMGAWWSDLEPAPGHYAWDDLDQRVAALARHNLQWEPLLSFSTTWGSSVPGDYTAPPAGSDHFGAFAAALAQRYGRGGSFWRDHPELPQLPVTAYEVWNEENAEAFWRPASQAPEQYADLYATTRAAIHGVDDSARVVVGGLAVPNNASVTAPADFLARVYAHRPDLRGRVDAVALHPYARTPARVFERVAAFRQDLDRIAGPGVPIEVTEIGWTTSDTPEQTRAAYLREVASTLPRSDCGVDRLSVYAWIGPERDAGDREQWFGIAGKPSEAALADAIKSAGSGTVPLCSSAPTVSLARRQGRRLVIRLGCSGSRACRVRVELRAPGKAAAARVRKLRPKRRTLVIRIPKRIQHVTVTVTGPSGLRITRSRRF
jgi:Glycosyl hydrolase catalytic core